MLGDGDASSERLGFIWSFNVEVEMSTKASGLYI